MNNRLFTANASQINKKGGKKAEIYQTKYLNDIHL